MRLPRLPLLSTGILAIAGLVMALGSAGFTPGHRSHPALQARPPQAPPNEVPCRIFLARGVDKSHGVEDAEDKDLTLYRTKGYYEHVSRFPKWVGGVKVRDNPGSKAFPGLEKNDRGCIYFQPYAVGNIPAYAQLWDEKGEREPFTYKHQLLCNGHSTHDDDVEPDWKETPNDCNTIQMVLNTTKGPYVKSWGRRSPMQAAVIVMQEVEDSLTKMGVPTDEIKRIIIATAAPGPWYPCAETGCCRAYEDQ